MSKSKELPSVHLERMLNLSEKLSEAGRLNSQEKLAEDFWFGMGISRAFNLVGRLSSKLPDEIKLRYPDVPWKNMEWMRGLTIHDGADANPTRVWEAMTTDIPRLIPILQKALAVESQSENEESQKGK